MISNSIFRIDVVSLQGIFCEGRVIDPISDLSYDISTVSGSYKEPKHELQT